MKKVSLLLLFAAATISCNKEDGANSDNLPRLTVEYSISCPDCYVYCKGANGSTQNFYHQDNSWAYSFEATAGDTLVLIAQNTSGAPAAVAGYIRLNNSLLASDTSYCPINGLIVLSDTL